MNSTCRSRASAPARLFMLKPHRFELAVADQPALLFIPETESERLQAAQQRDGFDGLKQRFCFVAFLQMVIRNARAEMMNVMKADVAGKPLQHFWQFVKRTAFQRRRGIIPLAAAFPKGALELMLPVKQPPPRRAGHHQDRQLNDEISLE